MARLQLTVPDKFIYSTELHVRVSDLNYGAHVGHDTMLTLMQEARVMLYQSLGFKNEVSFEGSVGQIISDASIQYKSEAFLGDVLIIQVAVNDFSKYGFDMYYLIINKKNGKEVAIGKTGIACFDYEKRKLAAIPQALLNGLQSL